MLHSVSSPVKLTKSERKLVAGNPGFTSASRTLPNDSTTTTRYRTSRWVSFLVNFMTGLPRSEIRVIMTHTHHSRPPRAARARAPSPTVCPTVSMLLSITTLTTTHPHVVLCLCECPRSPSLISLTRLKPFPCFPAVLRARARARAPFRRQETVGVHCRLKPQAELSHSCVNLFRMSLRAAAAL